MEVEKTVIMDKGRPTKVDSVVVDGLRIVSTGSLIKLARLEEEEYEDISEPQQTISKLKESAIRADIFTFCQRLPATKPEYNYHLEWDSIAAIPIKEFEFWWNNQVNSKTRNLVRKAQKAGVKVKQVNFDDEFVRGIVQVFNETPIRQGKQFWHYGKGFERVRSEFSRNLHREELFGAFHNEELIGFMFLAYTGEFATMTQILSKVKHRNKAPNNALIAKAVEVCAEKRIPYLVYAMWAEGSLGAFKKHNGFQKIDLPRYYCPLNLKGSLALTANLHHGLKEIIPNSIKQFLKNMRKKIGEKRYR